nr:MAG TPA: hypothetical protein [Caudoviricetes sp.]
MALYPSAPRAIKIKEKALQFRGRRGATAHFRRQKRVR